MNSAPRLNYGKAHTDHAELLYKVLKGEFLIIRSTLVQAGFRHTEGHDWNVMWMPATGKPYMYEGLNEYQKLNHFPCSYEVTRKDKLAMNVL